MEDINTENTTNETNDEVGDNNNDETKSGVNHLVFGFFNGGFFVSSGNPFKSTEDKVDGESKAGHDRERGDDGGDVLVENRTGVAG